MNQQFSSVLAEEFEEFLDFKRSLGLQYESAECILRNFDRFVAQQFQDRKRVDLKVAINGWLETFATRKPVYVTMRFGLVRNFCLHLRRRNPNSFVPDRDWAPQVNKSNHVPHIFTPGEIRILLDQVATMTDRFRSHTYRVLILMMYCTGLRIGETIRLRLQDVDVEMSTFNIVDSKRKTRWVPFDETLTQEIKTYLDARLQILPVSQDCRLLVRPDGAGYSCAKAISNTLRCHLRLAGLKPHDGGGPRPYDVRHSFAVAKLTEWYREGVDLQERLSWLAAYMGHDDLLGTQDYIHLTPELRLAVSRRHGDYIRRSWKEA